jgi:hypothetical protein
VILHPTSLPGKYGMGEIGGEAYRFVDWLVETGMQLWQVRATRPALELASCCPCHHAALTSSTLHLLAYSHGGYAVLLCRSEPVPAMPSLPPLPTYVSPLPPQLLPLVPPETTYWSPYSGLDALCGNTLLLPVEELVEMGLLKREELPAEQPVELHADFTAVAEWKVGTAGLWARLVRRRKLLHMAAHVLLPWHTQLTLRVFMVELEQSWPTAWRQVRIG